MAKGTLNVILHGVFVFQPDDSDLNDKKIIAWVPKLEPQHVYRAGNWLGETELQPGRYELKGVKPSLKSRFDPKPNLILKSLPKEPDAEKLHAKLIFDLPETITSLRVANFPLTSFDFEGKEGKELARLQHAPADFRAKLGKELANIPHSSHNFAFALPAKNSNSQPMATLQVFTYSFEDDAALMLKANPAGDPKLKANVTGDLRKWQNRNKNLKGHYWEPVFTGNYINLHIFSTEDHDEAPSEGKGLSHAYEDFNTCAELFGYKLRLKLDAPPAVASGVKDTELPPGVDAKETEDLAPRTLRMARLGRLVKEKGNADQAWYGDDGLNGHPGACGPTWVPGT